MACDAFSVHTMDERLQFKKRVGYGMKQSKEKISDGFPINAEKDLIGFAPFSAQSASWTSQLAVVFFW